MFEQVIGIIGAILIFVLAFGAFLALAVWILDSPGRREERDRRRSYRR